MTGAMAPRLSLLGKFVVLSLLATVLLAVVVGSALHVRIERRALANAEALTQVIGDLTIAPRLSETQLEADLRAPVLSSLDAAIARVSTGEGATFFRPGTDGLAFHPAVEPRDGELVVEKHVPNSFVGTGLEASLRERDVTELVIVGMMSSMCVDSTTRAAHELGLAALVCPTLSGRSARLISAHRPTVPIYALSPGRETVRRCGLMWGVRAAPIKRYEVTEELIRASAARVVELGWVKRGERVGITAGLPSGKPGTTSLLQVQAV